MSTYYLKTAVGVNNKDAVQMTVPCDHQTLENINVKHYCQN